MKKKLAEQPPVGAESLRKTYRTVCISIDSALLLKKSVEKMFKRWYPDLELVEKKEKP